MVTRLWRALEQMGGPDGFEAAGVAAFWREKIGEEFNIIKGTLLRTMPDPADCYPCLRECGCQHEVIRHDSGRIVGVCDCEEWNCDDIPLTEADLVMHELNLSKLGRAIANAFDCNAKEIGFPLQGTRQVAAFGNAALPVVLTIQRDPQELRDVIAQLGIRLRKGFVLLIPTSRLVDATVVELLSNAKAGFFDLESHVTLLPSGKLQAHRKAGELFRPYLPEPEPSASAAEAKRVIEMSSRLNAGAKVRKAPLGVVFEMLVRQGHSQEHAARECGCAPSLISARVAEIEKRMGLPLPQLKALATQLGDMELGKDSRAKSVYRKDFADYTVDDEPDE